MDLLNINSENFFSLIFSLIPLFIWGGFLSWAIFASLEKLLEKLRGKSFSWPKFFLIASFFVSGPFLIILGIIILIVRYKKASPEQKASIDNTLRVLKEQAQHLKEKTQSLSPEEFDAQLPDYLKERISETKPSEKSMQAAISPEQGFKQDHGIGRAILLVILIGILGLSYWIWKSDLFPAKVESIRSDSPQLLDR